MKKTVKTVPLEMPPMPLKYRIVEKAARVLDVLDILSCNRDHDFAEVLKEIRNTIGGYRERAQVIDLPSGMRINFGNGGGVKISITPELTDRGLFWVTMQGRTVSVREPA